MRSVLEQRFPVALDQGTCVIDIRDVAEAIDRALDCGFYGRPIPLAGHNIGLPDLIMLTARLAGLRRQSPFLLSPDAVSASVYWMQMAYRATGLRAPEPLGFMPLIADVLPMPRSREQADLGVRIRPLETTLREAIAFHRERRAA